MLSALTYSSSGLTHNAKLAIKVHGVVVHAKKYSSLSNTLNGTITVLTDTSLYP